MTFNLTSVAIAAAFLGLGMKPAFAIQTPGMQTQISSGAEMVSHESAMKTMTIKLDKSFRAITDARDEKGYVRDKSVLKAHEANIKALRDAVRHYELFPGSDEHQYGTSSKQREAVAQYHQQMKAVLHDVVESFDTFEQINDQLNNSEIVVTMYVGQAWAAHREALKALADAVAQHEQAMAEVMKKNS
jgi:hypothetical protein